jgi:3-deoxy-D-arabino-heptulosonate 7-phosphate (DAHP) synthase
MSQKLRIVAGPCSIDEKNIEEIYEIAQIKLGSNAAIWGTRVVGLKSRTALDPGGVGMGIDFSAFAKNMDILNEGGSYNDFEMLPSIEMAKQILDKTGLTIASEIMNPSVQMPLYDGHFDGKLMPWNPSVDQLGWPIMQIARFAKKHNWSLGIKNGKWIGTSKDVADSENFEGECSLEKTWGGLAAYAAGVSDIILIHRGVDVPEKGDYRNIPVHNIAKRTKMKTGAKLFFDPSHSYGPKMRGDIVEATIEAMKVKLEDNSFLYDGILIEAGTSQTDTEQHISLDELKSMVERLGEFREIESRYNQ